MLEVGELFDVEHGTTVSLHFDSGETYQGILDGFTYEGDTELVILKAEEKDYRVGLPVDRIVGFNIV